MKSILEQYQSAIRIMSTSPRQARLFASAPSVISSDTETTGLIFNMPSYLHWPEMYNKDLLVHQPYSFGLSFAFHYRERVVLVWARIGTALWAKALNLLKTSIPKTWHNARYDLRVCKENHIKVSGDQHCTLTMARIYWDRRKKHSLQRLSEFLWPELSAWEVDLKKEWTKLQTRYTRAGHEPGYTNYSFLPDSLVGPYSMTDSFIGLMLFDKLYPIMIRDFPELYERELRVMHVISKVEERGLAFNSKRAKRRASHLCKQMKISLDKMADVAGLDFNPNSPAQVLKTLRQLGVKDKQLTEKGKVTTGADKLREVLAGTKRKRVSGFIEELLLHRAYAKIVGTYLLPLAQKAEINNGVVHTTINPTDTRTGRPASRNPNLLNIPVPITKKTEEKNPVRECFVCRLGHHIYYFDISQQEMAVFGLYSNDARILDAYARGDDLHQYMADQIGLSRALTKNVNFGVIYGMGARTMALIYGMTEQEARENMRIYYREFPSVREFQEKCKEELQYRGFIAGLFGRHYTIPVSQAYKAVNAVIQGDCAQAFKIGLLNVAEALDSNKYILLVPYDEIQIERPICNKRVERSFIDNVCTQMVAIPQLLERGLELRVEVSKSQTNWAEKEKLEI